MNRYQEITPAEAKKVMDEEQNYKVVDVRTKMEYQSGHVAGAVCVPNEEINEESAKRYFPDKGQKLLLYCRSGVRSKDAAQRLADMGYSNVIEFGGIRDWNYEKE